MKKMKMLMLPGVMLGMSAMLCAADAKTESAPAPEAQVAGNEMLAAMNEAPKGTPVAEAFAFLPDVVAKVDGKDVTKAQFLDTIKAELPDGMIPAQIPLPMLKQVAPQMIEQFVQGQVIEKAIADAKIEVKPEDAEAKLRAEFDKMPKEQRTMMEEMLKAQGKSVDELIKMQATNPQFVQMVKFEKLLAANKALTDTVTPEEVQKFYDEHPEEFMTEGDGEGTIRASHILVKVEEGADEKAWGDAKAKIEGIKAELDKGADFGKLAEEKSDCPSGKQSKGSLGAFGKGQMVPEFENAAFALKEGELSGPVKTQFGYHLIRRDKSEAGRKLSFDEVKEQLTQALVQQKRAEGARKFVDKLMKDAKVEILVKAPEIPAAPTPAAAQETPATAPAPAAAPETPAAAPAPAAAPETPAAK